MAARRDKYSAQRAGKSALVKDSRPTNTAFSKKMQQNARAVALRAILRLQKITRAFDKALTIIKTLTILKKVLLITAELCFVVGGALIAWLITRAFTPPTTPGGETRKSAEPVLETQSPTGIPLTTNSASAAGSTIPVAYRWGVSPILFALVMTVFFVATSVIAYFAFSRQRYYLFFVCVALVGIYVMVLESYVQVFQTPIFGQFFILFAVLGAAFIFLLNWSFKRMDTELENLKAKLSDSFKEMVKNPSLNNFEKVVNEIRPQLEVILREQFITLHGSLEEKIKPLTDRFFQIVTESATGAVKGAVKGTAHQAAQRVSTTVSTGWMNYFNVWPTGPNNLENLDNPHNPNNPNNPNRP